jgi:hypothetical protein
MKDYMQAKNEKEGQINNLVCLALVMSCGGIETEI